MHRSKNVESLKVPGHRKLCVEQQTRTLRWTQQLVWSLATRTCRSMSEEKISIWTNNESWRSSAGALLFRTSAAMWFLHFTAKSSRLLKLSQNNVLTQLEDDPGVTCRYKDDPSYPLTCLNFFKFPSPKTLCWLCAWVTLAPPTRSLTVCWHHDPVMSSGL